MKLGEILGPDVKRKIVAVTDEPYRSMTGLERIKVADEYVQKHHLEPRIRDFVARYRCMCRTRIPMSVKVMAGIIVGHANGVILEKPVDPMRALRISAGDTFGAYQLKVPRKVLEEKFVRFISPASRKPAVKRAAA